MYKYRCACTDINLYVDSKYKLLLFCLVSPFIQYKTKQQHMYIHTQISNRHWVLGL